MTTLTDRLAYPNSSKVFLVEQTAGEQLNLWTLAAGQTYTYWCATGNRVTNVLEDGEALAPLTSVATVESSAGSYYWDRTAGRVYAHPTGGVSPYTVTLQAIVSFTFSTRPRVYNGVYYDPRIKSLPSLSMRVERVFGDPGQIGSGKLIYENGDGFFDDLSGLQWDAGRIVLKMGIDEVLWTVAPDLSIPSGFYSEEGEDGFYSEDGVDGFLAPEGADGVRMVRADCAYSDFDTVGTWSVKTWSKKDAEFSVDFEDIKGATKVKIPLDHFTRDEFPFMREEDVGKPKQIAYGQILDVAPVCVNLGEKRFRVAGHAIQGFTGIRMVDADTGYWVDTTFTTIDRSIAEFTVDAWDMKAQIAVDFFGMLYDETTLMDNPADVVYNILWSYLGYSASEIDEDSFNDSYDALVGQSGLSLYLSEEIDAFDVFSQINAAVGSYLFNDHLGKFRYVVYSPPAGSTVESFTEEDIFSFSEEVDATEIISMVKVKYQHRPSQDYWQVRFHERSASQYLQGAAAAVLKEVELPFVKTSDGLSVAQRTALHEGVPQRVYKCRVSAKGWTLMVADFAQITLARHGINGIFEVLERKCNLEAGVVDLVVGGLRGVASAGYGSPGHWCDEAEELA